MRLRPIKGKEKFKNNRYNNQSDKKLNNKLKGKNVRNILSKLH